MTDSTIANKCTLHRAAQERGLTQGTEAERATCTVNHNNRTYVITTQASHNSTFLKAQAGDNEFGLDWSDRLSVGSIS